MPYEIRDSCVYKVGNSTPLKCYDTLESAQSYLAALEANVSDAKGTNMTETSPLLEIKQMIDRFLNKTPKHSSFKAMGDYWHGEWSNNLQDRDGEWFSANGIKDYVARVDLGLTPLPKLWVWHGGKSVEIGETLQIATVEKNGVVVVSAIGRFNTDERSLLAKSYFNSSKEILGMSHGFSYPENGKKNRVYESFNTFELSVLPIEVAANPYTSFENVKEFQMQEKKREYYEKVFGKEEAAKIIAEMESKAATFSEIAEYKEFFSPSAEKETENANHDHQHDDSAMKMLAQDLTHELGDLAGTQLGIMKRVKEMAASLEALQSENKSLHTTLKKMQDKVDGMEEELTAKPRRASEAPETEVEDEEMKKKMEDKQAKSTDDFWGMFTEKVGQ